MTEGWTTEEWADRVAGVLDDARYINIGVGLPSRLPGFLAGRIDAIFHCENGILGTAPLNDGQEPVPELIDASINHVTLHEGAAIVPFDVSFAIMRGGHLDVSVLGAFQVSERGDLANWSSPHSPVAGVGGAMDLAVGTKKLCVMMHHTNRDGTPKIVKELSYPATATRCVDVLVTEYAVIEVTPTGLHVADVVDGLSPEELQSMTEPTLKFTDYLCARVRTL